MQKFYNNGNKHGPNSSLLPEDEEGISKAATRRHLKLREKTYQKFISDFNNPSIPANKKVRMFHESDRPF